MPVLIGFCRTLHDLNLRYLRLLGTSPGKDRDMAAEHAAIAEAAAVRRDAETARALLRDHAERTGRDLSARIGQPPGIPA